MTEEPARVPDMLLELYLLEELSDEQMRDVERRLEADPDGMDRLDALRESNDAILDSYPVMDMTRKIEHAVQRARFEERREPMIEASKRWDILLAAAVVLLGSAAVLGVFLYGEGGEQSPQAPSPSMVGGSMNPGDPADDPAVTGDDAMPHREEFEPVVGRNERAKELKKKLERGAPMVEGDVDTTGLILAMERKANRALIRGQRQEAVETCDSAREFDEGACPWLTEALAKFDTEGPESLEFPESLGVDDVESPDPQRGRRYFQDATKSMLKGQWSDAIKRCRVGLAHGETRCHRVLGISYKNTGNDQLACGHLAQIGLDGHDGLVCD